MNFAQPDVDQYKLGESIAAGIEIRMFDDFEEAGAEFNKSKAMKKQADMSGLASYDPCQACVLKRDYKQLCGVSTQPNNNID